MASDLSIDVYADIVCPWCYIGRAHLKQALAQRPDLDATLRWRPFQLQPDMPAEGKPFRPMLAQKFGGQDRAQQMFERVRQMGADQGLTFDFEAIDIAPNTVDAHRLVLWAEDQEHGDEMAETLFCAYFTEGQDVSDRDVLAACAADVGLDPDGARAVLDGDDYAAEVRTSQDEARRRGVTGVPCYVFDGRRAVAGAQPAHVLVDVFDAVAPAPTGSK